MKAVFDIIIAIDFKGKPDDNVPKDSSFSFTLQKVTDIPPFFST